MGGDAVDGYYLHFVICTAKIEHSSMRREEINLHTTRNKAIIIIILIIII